MRRIGVTWRRALVVMAVVAVCAALSATLYSASGKSRIHERPEAVSDGVNVILELVAIDPAKDQVTLRVELVPEGSYVNDAQDAFTFPLRMTTKNVVEGPVVTEIGAGSAVGKDYQLVYPLEGDPLEYPLDRYDYHYEYTDNGRDIRPAPLIRIERVAGSGTEPVPVGLWSGLTAGLQGWTEHWNLTTEGPTLKAKLSVERSGGLLAFVFIVLILMVVVANLALLVAWSAVTGRRPVEPPFAGWLAALLFALIPLRVNLPGAPPIGAWIDALVFFWIEIAVLVAMSAFIAAWFRFRDVPDYSVLHEARARRR